MHSSTLPLGTIYFEQYSLKFRRFKNLIWNLLSYTHVSTKATCFVGVSGAFSVWAGL